MDMPLPLIPAKRYFTIGEVAQLCGVKPHVLRYWEQEFTQLRPMKRRGNRRYYQHHEVLMIRRIRDLLYDEGFTISGARNKLRDGSSFLQSENVEGAEEVNFSPDLSFIASDPALCEEGLGSAVPALTDIHSVRHELFEIRLLLAEK
ncbi:MAG: MerR family transcriptional regulator [Simplicispira sp.]|nr:MerR family transcriptional regulator [Simplicispira sp.]